MRHLDRIDVGILELLQKDGRLSNKELAARVGLAPSSCLARVQRLTDDGAITGFHAEVDPALLGVGLAALITLRLAHQGGGAFDSFKHDVLEHPEVIEFYHLAGATDVLLRVAVRDTEHLRQLTVDRLSEREEIVHIETALIFEHERRHVLPCYE